MNRILLLAALVCAPCLADEPIPSVTITAERDAEWASYRHAYKAAASFERITRTRPLIQAHMQIQPLQPDYSMAGLQIKLAGEKTSVDIPVDALGRATIPMLKQAYEEDAVLRLNRLKGHYRFSGRFTIRERADGVYPVAELRAACEQMLSAQRESNRVRLIGKQCAAVRFVYPDSAVGLALAFRNGACLATPIAAIDGPAFERTAMLRYKVAQLRFADWPAQGEVVAPAGLLAIGVLYD